MDQRDKQTRPSLTIDWEAYLPFLENEDIPEDQKRALIQNLWGIMTAFVDLGFGVHPVNQTCGKDAASLNDALADMLSCEEPNTTNPDAAVSQFGKAAGKESK